jgi:4-diphosphocytidyl-2-C-methyl-D-erythritol kinase
MPLSGVLTATREFDRVFKICIMSPAMVGRVRILAPAKVNLHLEVFPPREDGYHPIYSIFQSVSWFDELEICSLKEDKTCIIEGEFPFPAENNLIWKAVKVFLSCIGKETGLRIRIKKEIPMGAGLGGGSSNAASTLVALNHLFNFPFTDEELASIGGTIGSDVPFFCRAATALVAGRGEKVTPISGRADYGILIVVPPFQVSTREAYRWIDEEKGWTEGSISSVKGREEQFLLPPVREWNFFNAFESVLLKRHPEYLEMRKLFYKEGAVFCSVSGSGSSMFGVYDDPEKGLKAVERLLQYFSAAKFTFPLDRRPIPILE